MVEVPLKDAGPWRLVMPEDLYEKLHAHLFPGDCDEHGAVITAGVATSADGVRLLARDLHLAVDGHDYGAGMRGYRMLHANFVRDQILSCRDEQLVYLAVHNHGGTDSVGFSGDDLRSHERGYPALLDIANGMPVGALVFAERALAGDIWLPNGRRIELEHASIVGRRLRRMSAAPPSSRSNKRDPARDRQARLFGDTGQDILRRCKVGIIGLGGVGSLIAEYLGRLGVGRFVLIDPQRIEISNLSRIVGATGYEAVTFFASERRPEWMRELARRLSRPKVRIARRVIRQAYPRAEVNAVFGDVLDPSNAALLVDCDYIFLAADTMRARLLFNAIVHQYLIPGVQAGSKVRVEKATGDVLDVFTVARPVTPDAGCMWCNGLISPAKLQEEGQDERELRAQRYVEEEEIVAPSVITLNATAASRAVDDFLFYMTGMTHPDAERGYRYFTPLNRGTRIDEPRKSAGCPECGHGSKSRLGRGDARRLPTWAK